MKLHPRVTKTAVELVKRFEGLRRRAARLPDGGWTIGYGHTLTAREGAEVTPDEAELLLYYDLSAVATKVEAWTFTPLSQNQFEALTAFAFNIGLENFRRCTVLKRVNEGHHLQAAAAMELWRKAEVGGEGVVADALVRRRAAEKAHYLTPPEGFAPSPSQVLRPAFDYSVIEAAAQSRATSRATVVEAPLDGAKAEARIERPVETPAAPPPAPSSPPAAILEAAAGAALAEAAATDVLRAPTAPAPVNDSHPLQARLFPAEADEPVFRTFEPPPARRFGRTDEGAAPPAANEPAPDPAPGPAAFAPVEPPPVSAGPTRTDSFPAEEAGEDTYRIETPDTHPGDFNLFDRPLAPPEPTPFRQLSGPALVMDDHDVLRTVGVRRSDHGQPAILHDRTVLFSAIGLLGVALFALAIFTMLLGKATVWHLLIGFLGVALLTPAGIFFLMQRMDPTGSGRP